MIVEPNYKNKSRGLVLLRSETICPMMGGATVITAHAQDTYLVEDMRGSLQGAMTAWTAVQPSHPSRIYRRWLTMYSVQLYAQASIHCVIDVCSPNWYVRHAIAVQPTKASRTQSDPIRLGVLVCDLVSLVGYAE